MSVLLLIIIGISGGFAVAGGLFALLTKVGVITRFISATKTESQTGLYQMLIVAGAVLGNAPILFSSFPELNVVFLIPSGLFTGVFTGALSLALAETIDVLPVVFRKIAINSKIEWIILSFALGKMTGSLYQMLR
ncbi:MAG: stage V sporulation protein AB [Clostridiales bacterium]|nr:stage V sporulation protein AB [Clostridiales bacterium]